MFLMLLQAEGKIPARVSIHGNTGGENDRICSNGKRMTNQQFFDDYVKPFADKHGIEAIMVEALDENGNKLPTIDEVLERSARIARETNADFDKMISGMWIPVFTNDKTKGRLRQACTDNKKIRAIHQEARRRGITQLRSAIGFHAGEAHRISARYLKDEDGWSIFKPQVVRKKVARDVKWLEHYYPCVDLKLNRDDIRAALLKANLPYLVTTECDHCPHQDYQRWIMHTPEVIERAAKIEEAWQGKLFFSSLRIPIKDAIKKMKERQDNLEAGKQRELPTFGCKDGAYCGI